MIREAVKENNQELCRELKESMVKELDYQFRSREEREEEAGSQAGTAQRRILSEDGRAVTEKDQRTVAKTAKRYTSESKRE